MAQLKVPVTSSDHIQGEEDATITLVEYGDYECPHCGIAYHVIKKVQKHYGPDLRFVFRNFPLAQVHPHAEDAAEAAEFAGAHDKFWEMHDAIYENQDQLDVPLLYKLGEELGLPTGNLRKALSAHEFMPRVRADFLGGVRSGVNGTPTLFINGVRHDGQYGFEDLVSAIDARVSQLRAAG